MYVNVKSICDFIKILKLCLVNSNCDFYITTLEIKYILVSEKL